MSLFVVCIHDESVYVILRYMPNDEPVYVILRYMQTCRARVCHSSLYANMMSSCMSIFAVGIHDEPLYVILRCTHI